MEQTTEAIAVPTRAEIRDRIDEMMDDKKASLREKHREICKLIATHLVATGKLYNCGNVATWVDGETHELVPVIKGSPKFDRLCIQYGIIPTDNLRDAVGRYLGAYAITDAPKNTIYTMSFYNRDKHLLYVNEYGGNFLRIEGEGYKITRLRNGDDDVLFMDGEDSRCEPLEADVSFALGASLAHPLNSGEGFSLIREHILDRINYSDEGVGRENAHIILMTALLGLFFPERIPSMPIVYLY
jgi:hypothetical protein